MSNVKLPWDCSERAAPPALAVGVDLLRCSYPVIGSTARQLRTVVAALGPVRGARRFGAFTDWEIVWRYQRIEGEGSHNIQEVTVEVRATITAPQWRTPRAAPTALVAAWREYAAAIETHEQGHVALAIQAADVLRRRLLSLPSFSSKLALGDAAQAVADEELRSAREQEIAYDENTSHGRTQGVVFPADMASLDAAARSHALCC